jgi:hypothetical protein
MKALFWIGLVVLILGIASFVVPIPHNERDAVNVAGVSLTVGTRTEERIPPLLSGVLLLCGVAAMIASTRKTS